MIRNLAINNFNRTGRNCLLHKTHYEVFDNTGKKHLGEANLNGVLYKDKAEKGRMLNVK